MPSALGQVRQYTWQQCWTKTAEILELAGNASRDKKKIRIIPRHLQLAIRNAELNKLMGGVTVAQGGVMPNIQAVLLPKTTEEPPSQSTELGIVVQNASEQSKCLVN
ncbi:unnamed protein product [Rangifer tarandus platyrhynchus]|uniref:Uncharacterized protein n=2 Tax=Rangifer tarandus platyrhynchus TaxID=3082113 RepID=A0ACB0EUH1_RANTA|nr:unnamed protein product [Rangifer tarandus platyrhynchus]CAI9704194.1 unnamed protein product [Rangifer tarandus platyrhynchus]